MQFELMNTKVETTERDEDRRLDEGLPSMEADVAVGRANLQQVQYSSTSLLAFIREKDIDIALAREHRIGGDRSIKAFQKNITVCSTTQGILIGIDLDHVSHQREPARLCISPRFTRHTTDQIHHKNYNIWHPSTLRGRSTCC